MYEIMQVLGKDSVIKRLEKAIAKNQYQNRKVYIIKERGCVIYMEYNIGDIVRTKKQHPCGSKLWEVTRVGVDFKLKCLGCGHTIMIERPKALKMIVKKVENS